MSSIDALSAYIIACKKHGVKRPNPLLIKFFQEVEPIADDIEDLDLSNNYIGNRGLLALLDVIEKLPNFRFLNISNQKLYNTDLSEDSVKGNATVDRVVEVFKSHPSANSLDISNNPVSNYAGRKLLGLAQLNTRICRIELQNTRIDFDLRRRISAQCEKNTTSLWEQQQDEATEEDRGFGEVGTWDPTAVKTTADLTALGGGRKARKTVHAEGLDPEKAKKYVPPYFDKSDAESKMIMDLLQKNVLFGFLTTKDLKTVAGAMQQRTFKKDDEIFTQGGAGDTLFVLQTGQADILKEGHKVYLKTEGTAVGELELMYDQPCVATVKVCTEECVTWFLDRDTYRYLVMGTAIRRREQYMNHLEKIPFLSTLDNYEKMQLADALSSDEFSPGETIIRYNSEGEWMYVILEGTVEVIGRDEQGEKKFVCEFSAGDYIGELEFLNNHRTVADVVAKTEVSTAKLNRRHFEMCMGPVVDVLKRNMQHPKYEYYQKVLEQHREPHAEEVAMPVSVAEEE